MRFGAVLAGLLLFGGLIALTPVAIERLHIDDPRERRTKTFSRELAEDVRVSRHGVYGVDFVRCGTCRLEKRKKGPLTFGAFNILVLEDLRVVFPENATKSKSSPRADDAASPKEMLSGMGLGDSFWMSHGVVPRFSGVRIERLEVCRFDGTNVLSAFTARYAESARRGLKLTDCLISLPSGSQKVDHAMLCVRPVPRLEWDGGELTF